MRVRFMAVGLLALAQSLAALRIRVTAEASGQQAGRVESVQAGHLKLDPYNDLSNVREFAVPPGEIPVFRSGRQVKTDALKAGDDVRIHFDVDAHGTPQVRAVDSLSHAEAWLARTMAQSSAPLMLGADDPPDLPEAELLSGASSVRRGHIDKIDDGRLTLCADGEDHVFQFDGTAVPVYAGSKLRDWSELKPGADVRLFVRGGSRDMPAHIVAIELLSSGGTR